ncbi:hypothetical protein L6R52_35525 [Myxococcota bacterium]|nr:hypothetical protein [Myxococcota bacterium]
MNELRVRVPESVVNALARRTARLTELVERATQASKVKEIREGGAQLVELLSERLEELKELVAMEDEEVPDRIRAFKVRLTLAEAKIATWPMPKPKATAGVKRLRPKDRHDPRRPVKPTKPSRSAA